MRALHTSHTYLTVVLHVSESSLNTVVPIFFEGLIASSTFPPECVMGMPVQLLLE